MAPFHVFEKIISFFKDRKIICYGRCSSDKMIPIYFLEFGAYYITDHLGKLIIKIILNAFIYFFHIIFIYFFDEVSNFCNRILSNQKHELMVSNCQWNCMYVSI